MTKQMIGVYLTPEVLERVEEMAQARTIGVSTMARILINHAVNDSRGVA